MKRPLLPMNYNDRRRLCEALGFTKTWMPLGTLVPTAPDWPPIDTDVGWAVRAMEAATAHRYAYCTWGIGHLPWAPKLVCVTYTAPNDEDFGRAGKDFPAAASAALLAALDAGALGGGSGCERRHGEEKP